MALTDSDTSNYRGELFLVGNYETPFLSIIGGLSGGRRSSSFQFPVGSYYALEAASQDVQSEDTAAAAGTPKTTAPAQAYNVCQIMKKDVAVTFKKQSQVGQFAGINVDGENPIPNALDFQRNAQLKQMAIDTEYSFINGTYVAESSSATDVATRGLLEAIATNAVAAGSAALSKALMDEMFRLAADAGCAIDGSIILVGARQKQKLSDIFGYAPMDRNIGGLNIKQIETDFGVVGVVYDKHVPAGSLILADARKCAPVFVPVTFNNELGFQANMQGGADVLWVPVGVTAAKFGGFLYTQIGLDYGNELFHAKITGLATA